MFENFGNYQNKLCIGGNGNNKNSRKKFELFAVFSARVTRKQRSRRKKMFSYLLVRRRQQWSWCWMLLLPFQLLSNNLNSVANFFCLLLQFVCWMLDRFEFFSCIFSSFFFRCLLFFFQENFIFCLFQSTLLALLPLFYNFFKLFYHSCFVCTNARALRIVRMVCQMDMDSIHIYLIAYMYFHFSIYTFVCVCMSGGWQRDSSFMCMIMYIFMPFVCHCQPAFYFVFLCALCTTIFLVFF